MQSGAKLAQLNPISPFPTEVRERLLCPATVQLAAEKAVPVTEAVTEEHLKPFVKDHAQEIKEGVQQLTEQGVIPQAEDIRDNLPEAAEKFTEETLKPAALRLSNEIEKQACNLPKLLAFFTVSKTDISPRKTIALIAISQTQPQKAT